MQALKHLQIVALLEGLSFLGLLFIAMPLKYLAEMPMAVRVAGSLHGVLFLAFIYVLFQAASERSWPLTRSALAFLSSLVPFGFIPLDRALKQELEAAAAEA